MINTEDLVVEDIGLKRGIYKHAFRIKKDVCRML